jgi:hypothetical protein
MSSDRRNAMSFESQQELEYLKQILKKLAGGRSRKQKEQQPTTPRSSSIQKLPNVAGAKKDVGVTGLLSQRKRRTPTHFSPTMDGPTHYQTGGAQKGRRPLNILSQTMGFLPPLPPAPRGAKRFSFSQSSMGAVPVDLSFPQQAGLHYDIRDHPNPPTRFSPTMKGPTHFQTGGAKGGRRPIKITAQKQKDQTENPPAPPKAKGKGNKKFFPDL